jgi:GNAT superfamily N-acetyltransferase
LHALAQRLHDGMMHTTITAVPPDTPAARACVRAYIAELAQRFDAGFDPGAPTPADDDAFVAPHGVFLLARRDEDAVGCGGLKRLDPATGEIKRLWVAPDARGLGLSRRLMAELETHARDMGLSHVRLDTNRALSEAQALYRKLGYVEIARYNDNPYADHWFEKRL